MSQQAGTNVLLYNRPRQLLISVAIGIGVFLLTSWALRGAIDVREDAPDPRATSVTGHALDSLAPRVSAGKVAVSTPPFGAQSLLAEVQPGDRMDVIALFPPTRGLTGLSTVIVRGATVLRRPSPASGMPILFEMTTEESLVVAHVVQSGTPLSYSLWPAGGIPPPVEPLDLPGLRARLGLTAATVLPSSTPFPASTAMPVPTVVTSSDQP